MESDAVAGREGNRHWLAAGLAGLVLAVFHLALASIYIDHPPQFDEMYHMLAAESWRESGELRILDGEYTRAADFTRLVALQSYLCGPSLECARSLSLLASALLVLSVTAFVSIVMGPAVGVVAGALTALNPAVVATSQLVRFYSLHALLFFLFAVAVYLLVTRWREMRLWTSAPLAIAALLLLHFADRLQKVSQVGLLAVVLAAVLISAPGVLGWFRRQQPWLMGLIAVGAAAAAGLVFYLVDFGEKLEILRWTPGWAEGLEHAYLYYHYRIKEWYPALWPLAAFLVVLSIARWPRVSLYCLTIFVVCFAILSIAGTKGNRYIMFTLPFLFIPLAGGMVSVFRFTVDSVGRALSQIPWVRMRSSSVNALAVFVVIGLTLTYLMTQPVVRDAGRMVLQSGYVNTFGGYGDYADWPAAAENLQELSRDYPTVLSSSGVKAAWYLGNFGFELNYSVMLETESGDEFGLDHRTGRLAVSSPESVREIIRHCGPALIIVEDRHANDRRQVSPETVALLDRIGNRKQVDAANLWVWTVPARGRLESDEAEGPLECMKVEN